jgi:hypothetical protein
MRPALFSLALLALAQAPATARAQTPGAPLAPGPSRLALRLDYEAATGARCPDGHAAADLLEGELGYDPRAPDAPLSLSVVATRQGAEVRVAVAIRDAAGAVLWTRRHQGREACATLLESAMVSASVALSELTWRADAAPTPTPPERAPAPAPMPPVPPPPAVVPEVPAVTMYLGADLLFGVGGTPIPNLGAGVWVAAHLPRAPRLSFELAGRASWTAGSAAEGFGRVRSALYTGELAVCGRVAFAVLCPVLGVGKLSHHGSADVQIGTPGPFLLLGARVGAEHAIGERYLLRGFTELVGLPDPSVLRFASRDEWRANVAWSIGMGFALNP